MRRLLICAAAVLPFVPAAVQFGITGIPDILFTGDGAALELGTRHAAHVAQLVGPYSRFGWNHPGPAYFYLALPFYLVFDQRGPALNLFAFCVNLASALFIVLSARRLRGDVFALSVAALLAMFELVAVPALLANEWNPILPTLPLLLACFLAIRLSAGEVSVLPAFALVASAVVQTHVGFAPAVLALCAVVIVSWRGARSEGKGPIQIHRRTIVATVAILAACWILPLLEAALNPPGNLLRLVWFFLTQGGSQHTWAGPAAIVIEQMAIAPRAVVETLLHRSFPAPSPFVASLILAIEGLLLFRLLVRARARRDDTLRRFAIVAMIQAPIAVVAVYSIRGFIYPHLVVWVSVFGLLPLVAIAAGLVHAAEKRFGEGPAYAAAAVLTAIVLALAIVAPVRRPPLIRANDVGAESLARSVESFLRSGTVQRPTVQIVSSDQWPIAVAIVLFLDKEGVPVYVEGSWLNVVGRQFAAPGDAHPALLVGGPEFAAEARARRDLTFVGSAEGVSVFLEQ